MSIVTLRPYQVDCVAAIQRELETHDSTLAVLHTGAGKSEIACEVIRQRSGRALVLAHRLFLLAQIRERISRVTGEYASLEAANWRSTGSRIVVASMQTLRGKRLKRFAPDTFSTIWIDEAHRAVSPQYMEILKHFGTAKRFGTTATPGRLDGVGAWNAFETVAYERGIEQGIADGYFVPIIPVSRFIDSIHLEDIKTTAGDLNLGQLETEIARNAGAIARLVVDECGDRKTITFCPGVASAYGVAGAMRALGKTAIALDATSDSKVRTDALAAFETGNLQHLVNVGLFGEGYDAPICSCVVMAAPTKSQGKYIQGGTRAGRPLPGIGQLATREERLEAIRVSAKPDMLLVDITGHAGRHSMITPVDILGGHEAPGVKERAIKVISRQEKPGLTIDQAIDESRKELAAEEMVNQERVAKAAARASVKARKGTWDCFARLGVDPVQPGETLPWLARPASAQEIHWLKENRLPFVGVTSGAVQQLQKLAKTWRAAGMASFRQRNVLSRAKCPVDVTFATAGEIIVALKANGWKPIAPWRVDAMVNK